LGIRASNCDPKTPYRLRGDHLKKKNKRPAGRDSSTVVSRIRIRGSSPMEINAESESQKEGVEGLYLTPLQWGPIKPTALKVLDRKKRRRNLSKGRGGGGIHTGCPCLGAKLGADGKEMIAPSVSEERKFKVGGIIQHTGSGDTVRTVTGGKYSLGSIPKSRWLKGTGEEHIPEQEARGGRGKSQPNQRAKAATWEEEAKEDRHQKMERRETTIAASQFRRRKEARKRKTRGINRLS